MESLFQDELRVTPCVNTQGRVALEPMPAYTRALSNGGFSMPVGRESGEVEERMG